MRLRRLRDPRLRHRPPSQAVATVSAVDLGRQFRDGGDGQQDPAVIQGMLDDAAAARTAEARGEDTRTFEAFRFIALIAPCPLLMIVG